MNSSAKDLLIGPRQGRVLCVALAGACALGCGVAMAGATATQADALTYTAYLTMDQFDGNHVAYLGQTTETLVFTGNGVTPTDLKSSNKKVAVFPVEGIPASLYVDFKKAGTTTITYKVNGKKHTSKWTIKKFTNPFATFKSGSKNLKSAGSAAALNGTITGQASVYTLEGKDFLYQDGTAQGDSLDLQEGKKLIVKPSKGWKVYHINMGGKHVKSGTVVPKGTGTVTVLMQNKKDKTIVNYTLSGGEWG